MQIAVESLNSFKKKISIEVPAQQVTAEYDKVCAEIRKNAVRKGFRKGKVPLGVIEKVYADQLVHEVQDHLLADTYPKAMTELGLSPISKPLTDFAPLQLGESFKYSVTVEFFPDVVLKEYLGLELVKEQLGQVDEEAVAARLKEMQERLALLTPAPEGHVAAMGDFLTFDFKGTLDGLPFQGSEADDYQLELGSGHFIPGFEEQLVGMGRGTSATVKVTFPENYGGPNLDGKEVEFAVSVKEIKLKELPELNDEFAKEVGEFATLAELKQQLSELWLTGEAGRIEAELHQRLGKALIEKNDLEYPELLVDHQLDLSLQASKRELAAQRLTLGMMGLTEEAYKIQFREKAREELQVALLLDAVAAKESLLVSEEEVCEHLSEMAVQTKQNPEKLAVQFQSGSRAREGLIIQMKEYKALKFMLEHAKVVELPKDQIKG